MAQARRHGEELTLALLDIDDFLYHNDTYGHSHADDTLRHLAESLTAGRAEDMAFRIGGDEFAVLLPQTPEASGAAALQGVRDRLRRHTSADFSAGLAGFTAQAEDAESLVNQADVALQEAKRRGGGESVAFAEVEGASVVTAAKTRAVRKLLAEARWTPPTSRSGGPTPARCWATRAWPARRPTAGINGPGEAFDVAQGLGRSVELDDLCRSAVLNGAANLSPDALLFVNVAPQSLDGQRLAGDALAPRSVQRPGARARGAGDPRALRRPDRPRRRRGHAAAGVGLQARPGRPWVPATRACR